MVQLNERWMKEGRNERTFMTNVEEDIFVDQSWSVAYFMQTNILHPFLGHRQTVQTQIRRRKTRVWPGLFANRNIYSK